MCQKGNLEKIKDEIKKCRLLCCKCHRIHTIKQLNHVDYNKYDETENVYFEARLETRIEEIQIIIKKHNACKEKLIGIIKNKITKLKPKQSNKCIDCTATITRKATRCVKCYRISQRRCTRPPKEILQQEIKTLGYCGTGRKYGVSDNAIRKWLKSY